jgi:ribonuclease-3
MTPPFTHEAEADEALQAWAARLGHRFARPDLLVRAVTHPTWVNERAAPPATGEQAQAFGPDYERLEFLGDAVLSVFVSQALLAAFPNEREGALSRRRAQLVRKEALAAWGAALGVARHVGVGQGLRAAPLADSIVADVIEAVVGAAFWDGGLEAVTALLAPSLALRLEDARALGARRDHKTELQERCHRLRLGSPRYRVVAESGPGHARRFQVELSLEGAPAFAPILADGSSKKAAEQACAQRASAQLDAAPPAGGRRR